MTGLKIGRDTLMWLENRRKGLYLPTHRHPPTPAPPGSKEQLWERAARAEGTDGESENRGPGIRCGAERPEKRRGNGRLEARAAAERQS